MRWYSRGVLLGGNMKRKVLWLAVALVLFDIGFVTNARATRRADRRAVVQAQPAPLRAKQYYPIMDVVVRTPIQLPNQLLVPGHYTFALNDAGSNVAISKATGEFVGTFVVVPAFRRDANGGLVNTQDAPDGGPDRIVAWFFPDQQDGYSFIYHAL